MPTYDWSKVSRETADRALSALDAYESRVDDIAQAEPEGKTLANALWHARNEALVPPLRTRAEVDAEIAQEVRNRYMPITRQMSHSEFLAEYLAEYLGSLGESLGKLIVEPTKD